MAEVCSMGSTCNKNRRHLEMSRSRRQKVCVHADENRVSPVDGGLGQFSILLGIPGGLLWCEAESGGGMLVVRMQVFSAVRPKDSRKCEASMRVGTTSGPTPTAAVTFLGYGVSL